eukprot:7278114-Pyramimonas_sp.AAC.1
MRNLQNKKIRMGEQWDIWCYRYEHEFSWEEEWLRHARWSAAQEATRIEVKFANDRAKQWRKLIADAVEKGEKQARRWSKLPAMWTQADIHPTAG